MNSINLLTNPERDLQLHQKSKSELDFTITRKFLKCVAMQKDTPFTHPHIDYLESFMKSLQKAFFIMDESKSGTNFKEETGWRLSFEKTINSEPEEREAIGELVMNEFESMARNYLRMAKQKLPEASDFDCDEGGQSKEAWIRLISSALALSQHLEIRPRLILETDSEEICELRKVVFSYRS
jgi:hypothetical protein